MNIIGTKTLTEREEEEAERLVRPLPKQKPPRRDRRRERMKVEGDPDVSGDPDTRGDPDMSLNRREVGGSVKTPNYSSYCISNSQMVRNMPKTKTSIYHGVLPYQDSSISYPKWEQAHIRELGEKDFDILVTSAKTWLKSPVLSSSIEGMIPDSRFRAALDLAIRDTEGGKYSSAIGANTYNVLLSRLAGKSPNGTLLTIQASNNQIKGTEMIKFAKQEATEILSRLDRVAGTIQENAESWGMPFESAKQIVNALDEAADSIEKAAFGDDSLAERQVQVLKQAKVLQQDSDEGYMGTFNAPTAPKQTDSDEGYMSLFSDDQTESVSTGKSTTGRPLAP